MDQVFKLAILGGGPIGAATAYSLPDNLKSDTILITQEPTDDYTATYLYAGGSLRWYWDEPEKLKATKMTAEFIKQKVAEGVDLGVIEDNYLFVSKGVFVPSLNVSGKKLVNYLIDQAVQSGLTLKNNSVITDIKKDGDNYLIKTSSGDIKAEKVLLCLGAANAQFLKDPEVEYEKRQLFVLDLEIDQDRQNYPHLILPFNGGVIFNFIKKTDNGLRMLLGQEDVVEHNDQPVAEDYFQQLLDKGLVEFMPYLKDVKVEKILWGIDATNKLPKIYTEDNQLFSVSCGSAVRSAIYIGQTVAAQITE